VSYLSAYIAGNIAFKFHMGASLKSQGNSNFDKKKRTKVRDILYFTAFLDTPRVQLSK
jgi:hypothetical protein